MKLWLTILLLCVCCGLPAGAADMSQPARWQVEVQDAAGRPLPAATVTVNAQAAPLNASGQAAGKAGAPEPAADLVWTESLDVTLPGFLPYKRSFSFFPGARMERRVTLYPARTTRVSVRGPHGEVIAGVRVVVGYEANGLEYNSDNADATHYKIAPPGRTDAQGDFVFVHPPLPSGFTLSVGGSGRLFQHDYPDAARVTAALTPDEMAEVSPAHAMRLKLLTPEGVPAAGWRVGTDARVVNVWCMTGGLNGPWHYVYQTEAPLTVGAAGVVKFSQSEDHFVVFSPQGVPLLYPLHPATWPTGEHRVTLRLPAVRRIQAGVLRNPDGMPAANVPICVSEASTGGTLWEVRAGDAGPSCHTDAQGRYALPQYFGTSTMYEAQEGSRSSTNLAAADSAVLTDNSPPSKKPDDYKQVTLTVAGGQGQPLPEFTLSAEAEGSGYVSPLTDTVGTHLFVPRTARRVTVTTTAQDWKPLVRTLDLPGTDDQTFTLTVPRSLHLKPLAGVILAPDGSPVSGVSLNLLRVNSRPGYPNQDYAGFRTETDVQGRFTFAAAPDAGEIDLYRFGTDHQPNLPGWIDPPAITLDTRQITVRLKPVGSVRALLPAALNALRDTVYLKGKDYFNPLFSRTAHTLHWSALPPGVYTLETQNDLAPPVTVCTVTVRAGRETGVDLQNRATAFPAAYVPTITLVSVINSRDEETLKIGDIAPPVSGAIVTLWTSHPNRSGWDALPADLTDETGTVRLPQGLGQKVVAVAHIPGQQIGWDESTEGYPSNLLVSLSPVRTLAVHLPPLPLQGDKVPYDSRQIRLYPSYQWPPGVEGVFSVLGIPATGFGTDKTLSPHLSLVPDTQGTWLAEDLPVWDYRMEINMESDVTLSAYGPAVVNLSPEGKPPTSQ